MEEVAGSSPVGSTKINSTPFSRQNGVKERGFIMAKYDTEFKLKVVNAYKNHQPLPSIDGVMGKSMIKNAQHWSLLLDTMGIDGLRSNFLYRNFTLKDKIKAVRLIQKGKSYSEVGRLLGFNSHATVRRWYLDYMKHGVAGLQYKKGIKVSTSVDISTPMKKRLSKSEREELVALRKRNEILELENEYLKKLDALVSKREAEEAKAKKQK